MRWLDVASEELDLVGHVGRLEHLEEERQARHHLANSPRALRAEGNAGMCLPVVQAQEIVVVGHHDPACSLGVG